MYMSAVQNVRVGEEEGVVSTIVPCAILEYQILIHRLYYVAVVIYIDIS